MTITPEQLAAALRERLPECRLHVESAYINVTAENKALVILQREPDRWIVHELHHRRDRDMARAVFDVLDELEDGHGNH